MTSKCVHVDTDRDDTFSVLKVKIIRFTARQNNTVIKTLFGTNCEGQRQGYTARRTTDIYIYYIS